MSWTTCAWTFAFYLWAVPAQAAVLDPWAFTSLGTLNASDSISINTDTLQLTGGASYTGVLDPVSGASIFAFDNITGTSMSIYGTRTLGLLSTGNIAFTGTIDLFGSGGLDMVGLGSTTLANVNALGGGQTVSLTANQINLGGTVDSGSRPLSVSAVESINLSGDIGSGVIRISGREGLVLSTGAGVTRGTVALGSGLVTLTGGSISGQIVVSSTTGQIVGSPGVTVVAPVPVPAASLLFATGIAVLGFVKRQRS
jgi:hypothetical protein